MHRILRFLLAISISAGFLSSLCFALEPKCPQKPWHAYQAIYTLHWHGLRVGTSTHTVCSLNPHLFSAEAISKPLLPFLPFNSHEKSYFTTHKESVRPLQYTYQIQEKKRKKQGNIEFHWQKNTLTRHDLDQPIVTEALTENVLDKITVYFQLRQDLIRHHKIFHYTVIEPQKTSTYLFRITGEEMLKTKLGVLKTVKLEHLSSKKERLTTLWLAKELDYLIVKLEQKKHGKTIGNSTLKSYKKI